MSQQRLCESLIGNLKQQRASRSQHASKLGDVIGRVFGAHVLQRNHRANEVDRIVVEQLQRIGFIEVIPASLSVFVPLASHLQHRRGDINAVHFVEMIRQHPDRISGYVCVNPNYTEHALAEIDRCVARGMIGIKLAASRRANDALLDPIGDAAARHGVPVLHHVWQHRRTEWPGQEASDGAELAELARRHPTVPFILAHIGGGGDWQHTLHAVASVDNIFVDLSGSGVDRGMLEACVAAVGTGRLLWGCDITMCTGWAKLRHLEQLLTLDDLDRIRWRNAVGIFPAGSFGT